MKKRAKYLCLAIFLITNHQSLIPSSIAQTDSALLQQIKNIEVSTDAVQFDEENLYSPDVSFQSFYDELSPYGEWIMISKDEIDSVLKKGEGQGYSSYYPDGQSDEDFLYIWQPKVSDKNWRPYQNGKWEYTTQGWMWVSDYNWGWGPYHYGRWVKLKEYGWTWMPGYVWAPSWVMWRVSDSHVGWVPLSPSAKWNAESGITAEHYKFKAGDEDWIFVPKSSFDTPVNNSVIINTSENKKIIPVSQKILDIKLDEDRIVSIGPDTKDIEKSTGKTIAQRNIVPLNTRTNSVISGNEIKVYKEKFKRLKIDPSTGRPHRIGKPKQFKHSKIARRLLKRRHHPKFR